MKGTFAYLWQYWRENGNRFYVPVLVYLCGLLGLCIEPRTFIGEGFSPNPAWRWLVGLLMVLPVLFPMQGSVPNSFALRWGAIALIGALLPLTPSLRIAGLFCGLAGLLAFVPREWSRRLTYRYSEMIAVWLITILTLHVYNYLASRVEGIPYLGYLMARIVALIGYSAQASESQIFIESEGITYPVLLSLDKFGGAFPWLLAVSFLVIGFKNGTPTRVTLWRWMLIAVTELFYFLYTLDRWIQMEQQWFWWEETHLALFFAPAILIMGVMVSPREGARLLSQRPFARFAPICCLLGASLLTIGWLWVDPGVIKQGAILVDEYYSDWEWSDVPLNTEIYGVQTVYNYYCMTEFFKRYFHKVERNYEPISYESLRNYSALILKTPTKPYPREVQEAIWRFIEEGGGVWVIGDHTNIFGMNTYLNSITGRYGIYLRADSTLDPVGNRQLYSPAYAAHPIVAGLRGLPSFLWYTGCSMSAPPFLNGHDVVLMPRTLRDAPDFSQNTFFGDFSPSLAELVGPTLQAYACYIGCGRLAIWTDSTLFSNFSITLPGKMELAVAYINFLNRRNWYPQLRFLFIGLGVLFLLVSIYLLYNNYYVFFLWSWKGAIVGHIVVGLALLRFYPALLPHTPLEKIAFYEEEVSEHLPILYPTDEGSSGSYLTAFVAALRSGKYPEVVFELNQAKHASRIVVVHGHQVSDWNELAQFVASGGTLIVLDGGHNLEVMTKACKVFGLSLDPKPIETELTIGASRIPLRAVGSLSGVMPILSHNNRIVLGHTNFGKGKLYVSTTESLFDDSALGMTSEIPNEAQKYLLNLLYEIYGKP